VKRSGLNIELNAKPPNLVEAWAGPGALGPPASDVRWFRWWNTRGHWTRTRGRRRPTSIY